MFSAATKSAAPASAANFIESVFSTYLYTGNGATQTITNGIDLSTYGGLVWIKDRSAAIDNALFDTARGVGSGPLISNSTLQAGWGAATTLTAFNTNGFDVSYPGSGSFIAATNRSPDNYASWTFRKQPKFFDIQTCVVDGSGFATVNHNLGSVPGCIFVKLTTTTDAWWVYHQSLPTPSMSWLKLNTTDAVTTATGGATRWTVSSTSASTILAGVPGATAVFYLFAHNAGGFGLTGTDNVITCGSATATAGTWTDVNVGFEPQWVLIKNSTANGSYNPSGSAGSQDWYVIDTMRGATAATGTNTSTVALSANSSIAEYNDVWFGLTSTGFSFKGVVSGSDNFIYIAIRRGPMKTPTSGTSVFKPVTWTGTGGSATVSGVGFPPDLVMPIGRSPAGYGNNPIDRLRGNSVFLKTYSTSAEVTDTAALPAWTMDGFTVGASGTTNDSGVTYVYENFRRAPGFFDEVCGTSTATANQRFNHNLGVAPEIIISKNRTNASNWFSYWQSLGRDYFISLNSTSAGSGGNTNIWGNTNPTATDFGIDTSASTGFGYSSGSNLVFYLFASCPGVSKVGSYTGNGSTQTISCGFAARFVMIKQTSAGSGTDWWVWDTARGMVAGTDPRLALNSTAAETNANWVYTDASGFQIVTSDAAVNASTKSYIFLAIA